MTLESPPGEYPDRDPQMFYEIARDRLSGQLNSLDSLDGKLGLLLSTSSALLAIVIAVFALRPDDFHGGALVAVVFSGLAWLLVSGFALYGFWGWSWFTGPKLPRVFDLHFSDVGDTRLKWRVAIRFWLDYEKNRKREKRKAKALEAVLALFVIQTAFLVAALVSVAADSTGTTRHSRCPDPVACVQALALAAGERLRVPESADLPHSSIRGA